MIVVLKLAEIERLLAQKGRFEYISVQVAVSLTWFIRRLASSYLGFDEHSYENGQSERRHSPAHLSLSLSVSQTLAFTFGKGSEMFDLLTNYFLSKISTNFQLWSSESDVVKETGLFSLPVRRSSSLLSLADLFVTLSTKKDSSLILVKNELFWTLAEQLISNQMPVQLIADEHKRLLIKGITCSCLNHSTGEHRSHFDQSIFQVLNQRLHSIADSIQTLLEQLKVNNSEKVHCSNALQTFHSEVVLNQISTLINAYCGLIEGGSRCSAGQIIYLFEHSQASLQAILDLLDFYHNYSDQVQIILDLFSLYAEHVLVYLNQEHSKLFYTLILRLLQIFSKCHYGKKSLEINADEDLNGHLYTLLTCLNHLLAKDFIDFSEETTYVLDLPRERDFLSSLLELSMSATSFSTV